MASACPLRAVLIMRIRIACDSCDNKFSVSEEMLGRRVRCPSCGEAVRVIANDQEDDEEAEEEIAPRRSRKSSSVGRSSKSSRTSKSSLKKRSSKSNGLLLGMGAGGGIVIVGLSITVMYLLSKGDDSSQTVAPQQVVTTADTTTSQNSPAADVVPESNPPPANIRPATVTQKVVADSEPAETVLKENGTEVAAAPQIAGAEPTPQTTPPKSPPPQPEKINPASNSDSMALSLSGVPVPSSTELRLTELIQRVEPSVVRINVLSLEGPSTGSGFVVSNDGTVVTNYHVVTSAKKADVEFANGTTAPVLGYLYVQPKADIAIIKIDLPKEQLKPVPLATELPLKGESVATFGAPHGLSFTTSKGAISAIRTQEDVNAEMGLDLHGTWLQTDAPISPGNSGGPLVDYYGRVVGMNTLQLSVGQNLNFAVSALEVRKALQEAFKDSKSKVKPLKPEELKPYQKDLARKLATEEFDTERGRRLFAEVKEIFLINASHLQNFDPTDEIWTRVIIRSQKAVEKSGIQLSFGEPAADAAVMVVMLQMKPSRRGTAGTQELVVRAELICFDPLAKKNVSPLAKVWKDERSVGTVSLTSAAMGNIPRTVDDNLAKFFSGFRSAYKRAAKVQKQEKPSEKNGVSEERPSNEESDKESSEQGK